MEINTCQFTNPDFCDVKIITSDDKEFYTSKWLLCQKSSYFRKLFENRKLLSVNVTKYITKHNSVTIIMLLDFLVNTDWNRVVKLLIDSGSVGLMCHFLRACSKFNMMTILDSFCDYFNRIENIDFFLDISLISVIDELDLYSIRNRIIMALYENLDKIDEMDFNKMVITDMNFCIPAEIGYCTQFIDPRMKIFVRILIQWLQVRKPSDEDIKGSSVYNFKYGYIADNNIVDVRECVMRLDHAVEFRNKVLDELGRI